MWLQIRAGDRPVPGMGRGLSEYTGRRFPVLRLQQGVTWEKERVKTHFYFDIYPDVTKQTYIEGN